MYTHSANGITIEMTDATAALTIDGQLAAKMLAPNWKPEDRQEDRVWVAVANMLSLAYATRPDPELVNAQLMQDSRERLNDFRNQIRGYATVHPDASAVDILVGEGNDRADVLAAIDSMIDAGLTIDDPTATDGRWITDVELDLLREQLAGGRAES